MLSKVSAVLLMGAQADSLHHIAILTTTQAAGQQLSILGFATIELAWPDILAKL